VLASTLGARCTIGAGAVVRNAYIFDGAVVGDNCVVEHAIVGAGARIGAGSRIGRGALVGDGVVLGPNSRLAPFERVSRVRGAEDDEWDSDSEYDEAEQGAADCWPSRARRSTAERCMQIRRRSRRRLGRARRHSSGRGEKRATRTRTRRRRLRASRICASCASVRRMLKYTIIHSCRALGDDHTDLDLSDAGSVTDPSDDDESSDDGDMPASMASSTTTLQTESAASAAVSAGEQAAAHEFLSEVAQSLQRAFAEDHSVENAAVELKTLRMAHNQALEKVRGAVIGAIVERIPLAPDPARQRTEIQRVVTRWGALINLIGGVDGVETASMLQVRAVAPVRSVRMRPTDDAGVVSLRAVRPLPAVRADLGRVVSRRYDR
jgi:translation initiation factor eIF-2B subunit epsilon